MAVINCRNRISGNVATRIKSTIFFNYFTLSEMLPQKDVFLNLVAFGYYLLGISWFKMILSAISFIKYVLKSTQGMLVTPSHSLNRSLREPHNSSNHGAEY